MEPKQNVICPFCGKDIPPESRYCLFCGQDLAGQSDLQKADSFTDPDATIQFCKSCGVIIPPYSKYCPVCGERQRRSSDSVGVLPPFDVSPYDEVLGDVPPPDPADENLRLQQRMLEVIYIRQHGMKVGGKAADKLFPFGWFDCSSMEHMKALTEAIDKGITIVETETRNREMVEGLRDPE